VSVTLPFLETASSGWLSGPVDLVLGPEGALYYCTYFPGEIRRIFYTGSANRNPTAMAAATPEAGYAPLLVQFSSAGSYDVDGNPLLYDWDFGDGSAHSNSPNPAHTYHANGVYTATLTVGDGLGGADTSLPLPVTVGNLPPQLTILSPHAGDRFVVGEPVSFSGSGTDLEEGALGASELHWRVHLHHLNHIHPVILDFAGASGSFTPGSHGEDLAGIFYRITLWAEDSTGLRQEVSVDVLPELASEVVTRMYMVAANDRDALSVHSDVRISGYNALSEPYDFVGADADQESAAMEFAIDLPPGSEIQEAHLLVVAGPVQNPSPTGELEIQFYDVDDALPFRDGPHGDLVGHHPTHSLSTNWPAGSDWSPGESYESADIASLVRLWLDRPGYSPGNHFGVVVSEGTIETGRFYGWADYAAPEQAPMLRVRFIPPPPDTTGPPPVGEHFALLPPTPNPFRDSSTISFSLAAASDVRLTIYDAAGRLVRSLVDGWQESGTHQTSWDGRAGDTFAGPGVYFLRLEASGRTATGRVVRLQ
jgi:PKD repeat protein